jgi:hypothetical protein
VAARRRRTSLRRPKAGSFSKSAVVLTVPFASTDRLVGRRCCVFNLFTAVYCLFTVHGLFTRGLLPVYSWFTACLLVVYCLFTRGLLPVHAMLFVHSWSRAPRRARTPSLSSPQYRMQRHYPITPLPRPLFSPSPHYSMHYSPHHPITVCTVCTILPVTPLPHA